tara:strand:+ start:290 stop:811 length:522 start_codon:yes stop_codon:yes gene_type:complete
MPKVEISNSKGVVQSSGEGMHIIGGTLSDSVGIHTYQELVTVPAAGMAAANAQGDGTGAALSVTLPANSQILNSSLTAVQLATNGAKCELNLKTHNALAAHDALAGGTLLHATAVDVGSGGTVGSSAGGNTAVVTTNTRVNVVHHANDANVTAGDAKVLVTIVYAGKGEPVAV